MTTRRSTISTTGIMPLTWLSNNKRGQVAVYSIDCMYTIFRSTYEGRLILCFEAAYGWDEYLTKFKCYGGHDNRLGGF